MLQLLISVARSVMVIGVVIAILLGGLIGAVAMHGAGGGGMLGFFLGAVVALVLSSIFFGVAAAIFDIQEQTKIGVSLLRQYLNHAGAAAGTRTPEAGIAASGPPPPTSPDTPQLPEAFSPRFPEGREGWRLLEAEAEAQGWKVSSGLSGVTFTHEVTGRRVRAHAVREAEQKLGLKAPANERARG